MVDENGDYVLEFKPFTDDSGNPIVENEEVKVKDEPATTQPVEESNVVQSSSTESPS